MATKISIVTVNYNGINLLNGFLNSVCSLDYLKKDYEVIVVDNGSSDKSVNLIRSNFPWVKLILADKNLGFGAGNNLGIKKAFGEYVLLLNNDTYPEKNILKKCDEFLKKHKKIKIGAINAKIIFVDKYLPCLIENATCESANLNSFKVFNKNLIKMPHDTSKNYFEKVYIPLGINPKNKQVLIRLGKLRQNTYRIHIGSKIIKGTFVGNSKTIFLPWKNKCLVDLIQNAGNFYFRDGSGRDRGVLISSNKQYYEEDLGQYNKIEEIPGFCGAGVLINKVAFNEINGFDESFFMYYEDGDLSFRLKNRGYKLFYNPDIMVRHIHSASSKEWSDSFIFNSERGRLIFLSKHWPRYYSIKEYMKYILYDSIFVPLYYLFHKKRQEALSKFRIRVLVIQSTIFPVIKNVLFDHKMSMNEYKKLL